MQINSEILIHKCSNSDSQFNGKNFNILKLNVTKTPIINIKRLLIFSIDISGSMSDKCSDGRSKMQHIIHVLNNIITFLVNENVKCNIIIFGFDNKIQNVVNDTELGSTNLEEIKASIDKYLYPRGSTNIQISLFNITQVASIKYKMCDLGGGEGGEGDMDMSGIDITHIFMTDGDANEGITDPNILKDLVDSSINNVFIGFGIEHNAKMINTLGSVPGAKNYFIDKIENAGLVYGEIIHDILYKAYKKIRISSKFKNNEICFYNWKTNTWDKTLELDYLTSDSETIVHFTSLNMDESGSGSGSESELGYNIYIDAFNIVDDIFEYSCSSYFNFVSNNKLYPSINNVSCADLTNYIYRQKTQELLFECSNFNLEYNDFYNSIYDIFDNNKPYKSGSIKIDNRKKSLVVKMKTLFEEIKKYMKDSQQEDSTFLKGLCDDIYIIKKTFNTKWGYMYSSARHCSQGRQQAYNINNIGLNIDLQDVGLSTNYHHKINTPVPHRNFRRRSPTLINDEDVDVDVDVDVDAIDTQITMNFNNVFDSSDSNTNSNSSNNSTIINNFDANEDDSDFEYDYRTDYMFHHKLTDSNVTCYTSPSKFKIMSSISQTVDYDNDIN